MAKQKKQIRKKRADGTFEAKVTIGKNIDGKTIRKSFYSAKSYEDAKLKAERWKIENEMKLRTPSRDEDMTFRQLAEEAKEIKKSTVRADTYESSYMTVVDKHLIPYFDDWKIGQIRRVDVERYLISKSKLSRRTIETHKNILRSIFNHAVQNGYLRANPADRMSINVGREPREKPVLTMAEVEEINRIAIERPTHISVAAYLMVNFGIGRAEVLGIKREDVDVKKKLIHICRDVVWTQGQIVITETKNKYRNRYVVVSQEAIDLLVSDPAFNEKEYLISPYGEVYSPKKFIYHFSQFLLKNNIRQVPPHSLRHTRTTIWMLEGKPAEAIAHQLGWSSTEMIYKHYAHFTPDDLRELLDIH